MSIDTSRARGIVNRFLREQEESARGGIRRLSEKIRPGKKLAVYEKLYAPAVTRPFIDSYVGGTNKYSFAFLLSLTEHLVSKDEMLARGEWDEKLVFLICHYIDHHDLDIFHGPALHVTITRHCIQRIYQRHLADEISEKDICVRLVLDQLRGVSTYADLWISMLMGCAEKPDENMKYLSLPIPSKAGLLLCRIENDFQLSVNTFVPNEKLSGRQRKVKKNLEVFMEPFSNSMLQFKHVEGALDPDSSRMKLHFRPMNLLDMLFDLYVHKNFNPNEYLELYGYDGSDDRDLAVYRIAEAIKDANVFDGKVDGRARETLEDLLDTYLEQGERRFLRTLSSTGFYESHASFA